MFKYLLSVSFLFMICIACNQVNKKNFNPQSVLPATLNRDSVPTQFYIINNNSDTVIHTVNGAFVRISRGSFNRDQVTLKVKEAYNLPDMILAGLLTQSNGRPIRSGGMIFLDAVEKDVIFNKAIDISIPTDSFDRAMQIFKGVEKDGKLNWVDPAPLDSSENDGFQMGRMLFQANCVVCHRLEKTLSGPALSGVEGRGPWNSRDRLFYFTRYPADYIPRTCYTKELQKSYGQIMPSFPQLNDDALTAVYDYIRNEDRKAGITYSTNYNSACDDSCYRYDSLKRRMIELEGKRQALVDQNGNRIDVVRDFDTIVNIDTADFIQPVITIDKVEKVTPVVYGSEYYKFKINSFGWYNVDALEGNKDVELTVEIGGIQQDSMSVFLVVPDQKVFAEGGPIRGKDNLFAFYSTDGKISLSIGKDAIVFALKESGGKIYFASQKFTSSEKQNIILEPKEVSKREFNRSVRKFRLEKLSIRVEDAPNADKIRATDKELKKGNSLLDLYRPKNCNCNCGEEADSIRAEVDIFYK